MEDLSVLKIFLVLILEVLFLLIAFIFVGLGIREMRRKRRFINNIILIVVGICIAIVSLYCARILLFY